MLLSNNRIKCKDEDWFGNRLSNLINLSDLELNLENNYIDNVGYDKMINSLN